jgi:hypothetical protein
MRYDKNIIYKTSGNKQYYKGKIYPDIPYSETDEYIITVDGDRLDSIAYSYYGNPELWWIISIANNNITRGSIFPKSGTQLRVPINVNSVLTLFDELNNL